MKNIIIILLIAVIIYFIYMNSQKNKVELFTNPNCVYWAGIGECTKNPNYMLPNCPEHCFRENKVKEMDNYLIQIIPYENNLIHFRNELLLKLKNEVSGKDFKLRDDIQNSTNNLNALYKEINNKARIYQPYTGIDFNMRVEDREELFPLVPGIRNMLIKSNLWLKNYM